MKSIIHMSDGELKALQQSAANELARRANQTFQQIEEDREAKRENFLKSAAANELRYEIRQLETEMTNVIFEIENKDWLPKAIQKFIDEQCYCECSIEGLSSFELDRWKAFCKKADDLGARLADLYDAHDISFSDLIDS